MSRSQRFFGGLVLNYGYQVMLVAAGIFLTPFYLRHIGQHDYGLWLLGTQLLTYLSLTDFGVVALLPLETAYATGREGGRDKSSDLPVLVGRTARLVLYQLPIVIAIATGMWLTIPAEWQGLKGPLEVVLVGFVISFPLRMLPALLQGLQDLTFVNSIQIVNWVVSSITMVAMVLAGWSLLALATGWLISQLLPAPVFLYRLWTRFPGVLPRRLQPLEWAATREQLTKGFWVSVAQVAQLLLSNTDLLIIGKVLGPAAVVPYACTGKLASVLANQAQILMQTATPGLCELKAGDSRQNLLRALIALTHGIITFSGLVFCVVILVNHWFVNFWVTSKQYGGPLLTCCILLNILVRHWTTTTAYSVFCFGYQRRISLTNFSDGLVTASASLGFTMLLGPVGAPLGSALGAFLVSLPFNLRIIARDTGVSVIELVRAMLGAWFWRFALLAAGVGWLSTLWTPKTFVEAAATAIVTTALYCLIMLPTLQRSPLGAYVRALAGTFHGKYLALQMRFSS
jgi:O-antigen/teichoic acid export membrane protein